MTANVHAQDMARYAQDALRTEKPFELWEIKCPEESKADWEPCVWHPSWQPDRLYRRKSDVVDRFCAVVRMAGGGIYVYEGKIIEQAARDAVKYHQGETLLCIVKLSVDNRMTDSATTARDLVRLDFAG